MPRIGVYILHGTRYYVGSTRDLDRRLIEHKRGQTSTTKRIGEWKLVKFFECDSLDEARELEIRIKKSKNISQWISQ